MPVPKASVAAWFARAVAILVMTAVAVSGCSGNPSSPGTGSISLRLHHGVDGIVLVPESGEYTNLAGNTYRVEMLRYFLSDASFHRAEGGAWYGGGVHLVDVMEAATLEWDLAGAPDAVYDSVRFVFGLDDTTNVSGRLGTSSQAILNMIWPEPMGGGYHYMMLQGRFHATPPDSLPPFNLHMGATVAPGGSVRQHFWFPVAIALDPPVTVSGNHHDIDITMNLNQWFEAPHTLDLHQWLDPRMQEPAAIDTLRANGLDVFSAGSPAIVRSAR